MKRMKKIVLVLPLSGLEYTLINFNRESGSDMPRMSQRMIDFLRPSFNFENLNPFRRSTSGCKNYYVEIRKYVLKNTHGSIRGRLNISGPKEIIGIFANHIFKQWENAQKSFKELKNLISSSNDLPNMKRVIKHLKKPDDKTSEVIYLIFIKI